MKVIVSAGGTGGHLYPALALVEYIKTQDQDAKFLFVGTTDRLESQVVPQMGYDYRGLHVKGFVGNPLQKLKNAMIFAKSLKHSKKILKEFQPDVVIGFGGYPSASIVLAASRLHIPTIIQDYCGYPTQEDDVVTEYFRSLIENNIQVNVHCNGDAASDQFIRCYKKALEQFPQEKTVLLGNPRASVVTHQDLKDVHDLCHIRKDRKVVLIVMGSLGSSSVNAVMKDALRMMQHDDFDIIYVTGKNYYDAMKEELGDLSSSIHLMSYIDDMPSFISSCDLVVSRAGATTLSEITALKAASLLIPSPYVVLNHQEYNAKELVDANAAKWILEKDLNAEAFVKEIRELIHDDKQLSLLKDNAASLGKPHACEDIYKEILKTLERK